MPGGDRHFHLSASEMSNGRKMETHQNEHYPRSAAASVKLTERWTGHSDS